MPYRQTAKIYQLAEWLEPGLAAPFISVVITTRNRPATFEAALNSVVAQRYSTHEIVVVQDGSDEVHIPAYEQLFATLRQRIGGRLRCVNLPASAQGSGSGAVMNAGVQAASGRYVAFLDDDDLWIDPEHLQRAVDVLRADAASGRQADLYFANQEAMQEQQLIAPRWLAPLQGLLTREGQSPGAMGAYRVTVDDLLRTPGFCHVNCLTVRRELYLQVGGRDESIRWEGDHNLYLRLIDKAHFMVHHPAVVARHHVPVPALQASVTTSLALTERRIWQARSMELAAAAVQSPAVRKRALRVQSNALKHAATEAAANGEWRAARTHAYRALRLRPSAKWLAFTAWCLAMSLWLSQS